MKWTREETGTLRCLTILSLFLFSVFLGGCSHHGNQYSYFSMLASEKQTPQNKKFAKEFWSSVRPVSSLSVSHYRLGNYYLAQEKYNKAIEEFSKSVWNDRNYCRAYNASGMSYDALKSCKMAQELYEQALQCDPEQAYIYNNYGCSRLLCGDYEKGLILLQKAAELSQENKRIQNNITLAQTIVEQKKMSVSSAKEMFVAQSLLVEATPYQRAISQPHNLPKKQKNIYIKEDINEAGILSLTAEKSKRLYLAAGPKSILKNDLKLVAVKQMAARHRAFLNLF